MKRTMILCVASMLLVGAAQKRQKPVQSSMYDAQLRTWIGATEEEVVRHFGPPATSDTDGDAKVLRWEAHFDISSSGGLGGPVSIGITRTETCHLSFWLVDDAATRSEWKASRSRVLRKGDKTLPQAGPCAAAFPADRAVRPEAGKRQKRREARQKGREAVVDVWVGKAEAELRDAYPAPPAVYSLGNTRLLTWSDAAMVETAASQAARSAGSDQATETSSTCAVTFWITDGVIDEWHWRGTSWRRCPLPGDGR